MKAIVLSDYGGVDKLELQDIPDPSVDARGLVVRMAGASLNPIDWKMRSGAAKARFPLKFPAILGRDVSGVVVSVGADVKGFVPGDRVLGLVWGAHAELVAGPAEVFAKVPAGLDLTEAGALPLVLLTGAELVEEAIAPAEGDVVLVTGALGGVGRTALFAARQRGARPWAGVRKSQLEEARELGAEGVVALDDDLALAGLPTLSSVADTVGGPTVQKLYPKIKRSGVIGSVLGEPPGAKEQGLVVRPMMAHPDGALLAKYASAVAMKKLTIPIARKLPLAQAREAHELAERHAGGKIVLVGAAPGQA